MTLVLTQPKLSTGTPLADCDLAFLARADIGDGVLLPKNQQNGELSRYRIVNGTKNQQGHIDVNASENRGVKIPLTQFSVAMSADLGVLDDVTELATYDHRQFVRLEYSEPLGLELTDEQAAAAIINLFTLLFPSVTAGVLSTATIAKLRRGDTTGLFD